MRYRTTQLDDGQYAVKDLGLGKIVDCSIVPEIWKAARLAGRLNQVRQETLKSEAEQYLTKLRAKVARSLRMRR